MEPCFVDGVDSVATCQACGRRVCNRHLIVSVSAMNRDTAWLTHGTEAGFAGVLVLQHPVGESTMTPAPYGDYGAAFSAGAPRCVDCREQDGARAVEAAAQRSAERSANQAGLERELQALSDPSALVRRLLECRDVVTASAAEAAWTRIASGSALRHSHDIVFLERVANKGMFGSAKKAWVSQRRERAWVLVQWASVNFGDTVDARLRQVDGWLCADGSYWVATGGSQAGSHLVAAPGARPDWKGGPSEWVVVVEAGKDIAITRGKHVDSATNALTLDAYGLPEGGQLRVEAIMIVLERWAN